MKALRSVLALLLFAAFALPAWGAEPVTIRVGKLLDGKGGSMSDVTVVIEGSRIVGIETKPRENPTWDLRHLTLMPGGIDTHVHIGWHFGRNGKLYDERRRGSRRRPRPTPSSTPPTTGWRPCGAGSPPCRASARPRTRPCATPSPAASSPGRAS